MKTKEKKDFNANYFTDIDHDTIVEIYLKNTKVQEHEKHEEPQKNRNNTKITEIQN